GARHVYAIDRSPMINVAGESYARCGRLQDATFIAIDSREAQLPEGADLVVADQAAHFGPEYGLLADFADAAQRFLKPGGRLLPARITLHVALVSNAAAYEYVAGWNTQIVPQPLHWVGEVAAQATIPVRLSPEALHSDPVEIADITLGCAPPAQGWSAELQVRRNGTVHGLAGWFEC